MSERKKRSDAGRPRKPELDIPDQAKQWFARQPLIRREQLLRDLTQINKYIEIRENVVDAQPAVTLLDGQTETI